MDGQKGQTGETGMDGLKGEKGSQGDPGIDGNSFDIKFVVPVLEYVESYTSETWPFDTPTVGEFAITDLGVEAEEDSRLYLFDGERWVFKADLSGARGLPGEQGSVGDKGEPGQKGDIGPDGKSFEIKFSVGYAHVQNYEEGEWVTEYVYPPTVGDFAITNAEGYSHVYDIQAGFGNEWRTDGEERVLGISTNGSSVRNVHFMFDDSQQEPLKVISLVNVPLPTVTVVVRTDASEANVRSGFEAIAAFLQDADTLSRTVELMENNKIRLIEEGILTVTENTTVPYVTDYSGNEVVEGKLYCFNGVAWDFKADLKGMVGEKGEVGEKGTPGDKGLQGVTGQKGERGEDGLKGAQGIEGQKGATGLTGEKGPMGAQGPQGYRGPRGRKASMDSRLR